MPVITAPNKQTGSQVVNEFVDTVGTVDTVYSFPDATARDTLKIDNLSAAALTVTVGAQTITVDGFKSGKIEAVSFTQFTIKAAGYGSFRARSSYKEYDDVDERELGNKISGLQEKIDDVSINVKKFGAVGDGVTDDTNAIQTGLNNLISGQTLFFPSGTYSVSNLTIPNTSNIGFSGASNSVIKKNANGLSTHLIASYNYLNNVSVVGSPLKINGVTFDGNDLCDDVIILQTWNSVLDKITARNGLRYGVHFTANTLDGTLITTTAVNNRLINSWIYNNDVHNVHITDSSRTKVSDLFIRDNYIYTAQVGVYLQTSAGVIFSGNHLYGHSDYDMQVSISSFAFQLVNNYFEGSTGSPKKVLYIQDFIANTSCIFANNTVAGEVRMYSANVGSQFLSTGNNYRTVDGCIKNNWNIKVTVVSTGDRFESQRPFLAVDNNWLLNASSNSLFIVNGSTTNYFGDVRKIEGVINASNTILATVFGTAAPTVGTFSPGSICWNTAPAAAGKVGWICTAGGTPGTWKAFGVIDA